MNNKSILFLFSILLIGTAMAASAGYKFEDNGDNVIFTIDPFGSTNATGNATIQGGLLVGSATQVGNGNVNISGTYYGDGAGLTGVTADMDYTNLALTNQSNTFTAGNITFEENSFYFTFGSIMEFQNSSEDAFMAFEDVVTIFQSLYIENSTDDNPFTIDVTTGDTELDGFLTIGTATLAGSGNVNISGTYYGDGSGLTGITADMDYTNIAMQNDTNTFVEDQVFSKYINMTNDQRVVWAGGASVEGDVNGDMIFKLG